MFVIAKPHLHSLANVYWDGRGGWMLDKAAARRFPRRPLAEQALRGLGMVRDAWILKV